MVAPPVVAVLPRSRVAWVVLVAHNVLQRCATAAAYTCVFTCINNSCARDARGAVNGAAMSIASIFKAAGPSAGAVLYAVALTGRAGAALFGSVAAAMLATALVARRTMGVAYDSSVD